MLKRMSVFTLFSALLIGIIGCSSESSNENDLIAVTIENASFILPGGDSGVSDTENKGFLAVDLKVENQSKSSIDVSPYDGIKLYDGEEQLSPETNIYNSSIDLEGDVSSEIGPEKVKTLTTIFYVENDKEYEIGVKPFAMDLEDQPKEVIVPLDTSEYTESFETLDDPAKALSAYIDTVYMGQENTDYEKYVSADKAALQEEAKNIFAENIEMAFTYSVPSEEIDKQYDNYQSLLAQHAEVETETIAHANEKAVVRVEYSTISLRDLYRDVLDYEDEYLENTGDFDMEKAEQYAISKLDTILNSIEVKPSGDKLEILMIQQNGKWTVDTSDWNSEMLVEAFAGS